MRDFSPYFRSTVGFDQLFNRLEQAVDAGNGYPPYNIERTDETHYVISVAVAGFGDKDLNVEVKDGVLTVTGKREDVEKQQSFLYQGIAGRAFADESGCRALAGAFVQGFAADGSKGATT